MAASLQYLLITVKVVALEKVSFSDTQNLKTVNILIFNDKDYLLTRDSLMQRILMILYQKQKNFSEFFLYL